MEAQKGKGGERVEGSHRQPVASGKEQGAAGQDEEDSDLHESLLYKFYLDHRAELSQSAHNLKTLYQGDTNVYSEEQIEELLKTFKDQQDQLKTQKDIGPYYIKSMSTFKYLQLE